MKLFALFVVLAGSALVACSMSLDTPASPSSSATPVSASVTASPAPSASAGYGFRRGHWDVESHPNPIEAYRRAFIVLKWTPDVTGRAAQPREDALGLSFRCTTASGQREFTAPAVFLGSADGTLRYGIELTLTVETCALDVGVTVGALGPPFSREVAVAVARTSWPVRRVDAIEVRETTWSGLQHVGLVNPVGTPRQGRVIIVVIAGELQFPSPSGAPYPWGLWLYDALTGEELSVSSAPQTDPPGLPAWLRQLP